MAKDSISTVEQHTFDLAETPASTNPESTCQAASRVDAARAQPANGLTLHLVGSKPLEGGKAGEGGAPDISNAEFVAAIFPVLPQAAFAAVCTKEGDPGTGGWTAIRSEVVVGDLSKTNNNYINCSSFYAGTDGIFKARKNHFAACHFLLLDDLGTKVPLDRLAGIQPTWLIETSSGNFQGGIVFDHPLVDGAAATRLLSAIIDAGLCDPGSTGPLSRWARLPEAINGKPKHADSTGKPFSCRLVAWRPDHRYTPEQIVERLDLTLPPAGRPRKQANPEVRSDHSADDVLTPRADVNPVVAVLKERGLYKTPLGSGRHDITCPWVHEHTDGQDSGTAYFEPDEFHAFGGFCCQHSHRDKYHITELLTFLGIQKALARHRSVIRVVAGDLYRVVDAAEHELANAGRHYQCGGLIVSVSTDPMSGNPSIVPTSVQALTRELSIAATWEKYDQRSSAWACCDPPTRHVANLYEGQSFRHLKPLSGVARQPYFIESGGRLVTQPGYDEASQRFGVFDPRQFVLPRVTEEAAREALAILETLLTEFRFVADTDHAAALSAIFTAAVRPTLAYAPAFHVRAPMPGSGKTYLCELIGAFAGPAGNSKVSYPTTSEEATKVILSLLLTSPAVIEFDDMDTDWIPHGVIKRMLTADRVTERILGVSKTATVSTRTLFLGSGNNVGPVRDLLRRVLTIHIDPRCATPATTAYSGSPVDRVRENRPAFVTAVLTIIEAWRAAGSPRAAVDNIATFGGAWSDYCRHPLIWLGHRDPASSLLHQIRNDADAEALGGLLREWSAVFGSSPTTLRKAVSLAADMQPELLDAMREFPVEEKGQINRSKLGWVLKKNVNRIVDGLEFQRVQADGRAAWRVASVDPSSPSSPPSPSSLPPAHTQSQLAESSAFDDHLFEI